MRRRHILPGLGTGALILAATVAWAGERQMTFTIENMTCAACPIAVRMAMARVPGVKNVKVDLHTRAAVVIFDDSVATPAMVTEASRLAGFPAKPKE